MTTSSMIIEKNTYSLNGRNISIPKSLADKYSNLVCPITESLLSSLIKIFGDTDDKVLSAKIETDMEQEIREYEV